MLHGARRVIAACTPRVAIEVHSEELEDDCLSFLHEYDCLCKIVEQQHLCPELRPREFSRWIIAIHHLDDTAPLLGTTESGS